jgi:RNA polymerase sigma factor for flagellar operon FliA
MNAVVEPAELTDSLRLSAEARERLILEHLPQVRLLARRIHDRLPENVSLDDLVSTGILGLISAIDRFDPSRQIQLRTYAEYKIKGGILDSLRRLDWAPRQDRKHAKQIAAAIAVTEQRLQRSPTEEEIATELNLTVDRYHQWQVKIRGLNLGRLESAGCGDSGEHDLLRARTQRTAGGLGRRDFGKPRHREDGFEAVLSRRIDVAWNLQDRRLA